MVLLAIAELALSRPGFDDALGRIADQLVGREMFNEFKRFNADRVKASHGEFGFAPQGISKPPERLEQAELYAWLGEDEFGSGEIGLKRAIVPAGGDVPMVAVLREKMEKYWQRAEAQAAQYRKRIYLVRFKFAEVLRETEKGDPVTR
jgi:hypothetical protein